MSCREHNIGSCYFIELIFAFILMLRYFIFNVIIGIVEFKFTSLLFVFYFYHICLFWSYSLFSFFCLLLDQLNIFKACILSLLLAY